MTSTIDLRVLELACSRLCHDLISPITAVNNGMELLSDSPPDVVDEIKGLLTASAGEAARRLQFYRIAYGLGGDEAAPIGLEEAGRLARGLLAGGKIELDWPNGGGTGDIGRSATKILLNTLLLGIEALPRGGRVAVAVEPEPEICVEVLAEGQGARITEESEAALSPHSDVDALTPRSVQAYLTARLVGVLGGRLDIDRSRADAFAFRATVPR